MRIHREGTATILLVIGLIILVNIPVDYFINIPLLSILLWVLSFLFFGFIVNFFRNPTRTIPILDDRVLICPADGKVVVIEKTFEPEYLKKECMQISIFMSPLNVHVNRYPLSGIVTYVKYHPGLFLVAWHPKSSTENERTTVAVKNDTAEILFRQIAGKVARRIVCYSKIGNLATIGSEFGFIKFGSRLDIFLPLDAAIMVNRNQDVRGGETILAQL